MSNTNDVGSVKHSRISKEQEEDLVDRLYRHSLEQKEKKLKELDAHYYPVAKEKKISNEEMTKSAERQVDVEMNRRKQQQEENDKKFYEDQRKTTKTTKITQAELEQNIKHLYDDTLARKKANREESQKRYLFDREKATGPQKLMKPEDFKASVERMSKPKKTEFTTAEINKIYGLS